MNCPVCARSLAPTLSICPACGAMMNDTVREELRPKISTRLAPRIKTNAAPAFESLPSTPRPAITPPVAAKKRVTAGLVSHKTSQTLVEFQHKNTSLPDWRLQLQNAVQQRKGGNTETIVAEESNSRNRFSNNKDAVLKAAPAPQADIETARTISDPRVSNAMRRIEESRKTFHETPVQTKRPVAQMRPFGVVSTSGPTLSATAAAPARINTLPKPTLVSPPTLEKRNTNKLAPIEPAPQAEIVIAKPVIEKVEKVEKVKKVESGSLPFEFPELTRIQIRTESSEIDPFETREIETDEIEDLAPMSMRFGAGLFDFIIGGFASMLLLSPLAFTSANWFTTTGILTFAATLTIVMFVYMTSCLGFFGKTMGMRLFQLELVDAVENEYPTLRQAAINSSVFIIMLAFAGAGFLTIFFNEERRALHELLSGTILVREF